jgi:hypothetical protein
MTLSARYRRLFAGILLFALMLQTLLPAMAGAVSEGSGRWIEVCANSGVKWVKLDAQTSAVEHASDGHCVLCAATGAAPDFDVHRYLQTQAVEARPLLAAFVAPRAFPGHALRSRAPPIHA